MSFASSWNAVDAVTSTIGRVSSSSHAGGFGGRLPETGPDEPDLGRPIRTVVLVRLGSEREEPIELQ